MTVINQNTVVVFNSTELKEILEKQNDYNYIFLGSNITLLSGIAISGTKIDVTIDGNYNRTIHEYVDQKKLGQSDGIYVTSPNTAKVTIKNMIVTGYNYYGVIFVPESSGYKNTTIQYYNVTYTGPQISYNPVGLTRFIDSLITIEDNYASGNEVAECNRIEIGGFTTIIHNSTSNSAFWFRNANPSFTVLREAKVYFTSKSRELFYGVSNLEFIVEKNASFYVTAHNGLAYGTYGTGSTLIDENAIFSIKKTNYTGSYATWYSYGIITLNKYSSLNIVNNYDSITTSNYNIYFMGTNSGLELNSPKKVVLYNSKANVINSQNTSVFNFTYDRINLFNVTIPILDNISKDMLPTYSWYKSSEMSSISGTFTSSGTTIEKNNYTSEELKTLPSLDNFNIANKKILSIGIFSFSINAITDKDTNMSGITSANASVLISYNDIDAVCLSDEEGNFSYLYDNPLPVGTIITFTAKSYEDVIYYTKQVQVVYSGELIIDSATKNFRFEVYAMGKDPIICPRLNDLSVTVIDSRVNSSNWKLYASINHDLESGDGDALKDSLVFVDDDGNINVLSSTPTLVYTGVNNGGNILSTSVSWEEEKGILLQLLEPLEINTYYDAEIIWSIEE